MLIQFAVSNFACFDDMQVFSMQAGSGRKYSDRLFKSGKNKYTKFKAIYGANASGKSAFVSAIGYLTQALEFGFEHLSRQLYCKIDPNNSNKPSLFEIIVHVDGKELCYGFKCNIFSGQVLNEWLIEKKGNDTEKIIFTRDTVLASYTCTYFDSQTKLASRLKVYFDDVKQDSSTLFLKVVNQNKNELYEKYDKARIFRTIYEYIIQKINITNPEDIITTPSNFINAESSQIIARKLSYFGTGITGMELVEIPLASAVRDLTQDCVNDLKSKLAQLSNNEKHTGLAIRGRGVIYFFELSAEHEVLCKTLQFSHGFNSAKFSLSEESDGTNRLLDLIEILISDDDDRVFIVDELNRCLHPLLTQEFVKQFLQSAINKNIQLIVTTHETRIMDLDLLRRDEIGLISKDEYGASHYEQMDSKVDRFDKVIRNAYIHGDYNAIPVFRESSTDNM